MKRKILSLILVFAMTVSLLTVGTGAVEPAYGDTAGHWAESSIERWSGHGIIQGSNGLFDPNGQLTCAQLATILAKLLKLPAAKDAGFTDNTADAWYYDAINRCAAAGILNGNGDGTVTPDAPISRERAMVMLARALGIEPIREPDLTKYSDAAKVAPYAQGMVAAMIEAGIVGGVTADELAPQDNINRASTVTILDRAISTYADKAGATVKADGKGIVLVVADDVTVTGDVDKLLVPADNVDVTVSGSKNIDDITVTGDNSKVILNNSTANDVTLDGKNTELETKGGSKVENVSVTEDAKGATVNAGSGTTVKNVENSAADTTVTGSGSVKNVASDTDVTVETKGTEVKNTGDGKITVTDKNGKDSAVNSGSSSTTTGGSTSSGSSGSSSGGSSSGGGHSHRYTYTDNGDGTHTGTCYADDSTRGPEDHVYISGISGTCIVCGAEAEGKTASVKNTEGVIHYYDTLSAAIENANAGDTVYLLADVTLSSTITVLQKTLNLDLNGHTITAQVAVGHTAIDVDAGSLTVLDSSSEKSGKLVSTYYGIMASNGGTIIMQSGTISSARAALCGNNTYGNMNFVVNGGTLTAERGAAIYMSGQGSLTVTGGTLNGGISLRMGQVNISGGTINATAENIDSPEKYYNHSTNVWFPDALYVLGGTYVSRDETYGNSLSLKITGGTFNCANGQGSAVAVYDCGAVEQKMDVKISGTASLSTNASSRKAYQVLSLKDIGVGRPAEGYNKDEYIGKVTSTITGGTFSSDPTAYVADGYITLVNGDGIFTVSKTNEIPVTAETVQDYLDGKYGSINGKTLVLAEGDYDKIEFGRATAYKGSNTKYYLGGTESSPDAIKQDIAGHPHGGAGAREYVRYMSNVTLKAADGATVTINGLVAFGGQVNNTKWYSRDFVADREMPEAPAYDNNISYWIGQKWSNITFEGLTFTGGVDIEAYGNKDTLIDNVKFYNCKFNIANNADATYCIRLNVDGNIAKANNLVVTKCDFANGLTAVLTDGMPNVTVTGSTFSGLKGHAISPMMNYLPSAPGYGNITVTGNTFTNMTPAKGDRVILRMGDVGVGAVFTIQNNTATGCDGLGNSIKVNSLTDGITYNISGNNWGSLTASDPKLNG